MSQVIEVMRETRVPAGIDTVWAVVSDAGRAADWFDFADRTEVRSGDGVGQLRTQHGHWGRRRSEVDQEITECVPGKVLAWRHVAERIDGRPAPKFATRTEFRIELDGDAETTTVRLRSLQTPGGPVKGWLMRRVGTKDIERNMDRSLERLAGVLS
ncbi:SRPBCC family protein [Actinophytocola glycyrrhizae]|uniref:SRPBCC family protein n=1 Tax=Actinophytocola glycyrrhizae TaxID=2044873 RepID=A0ABV9S8C4_9PSEU